MGLLWFIDSDVVLAAHVLGDCQGGWFFFYVFSDVQSHINIVIDDNSVAI